MKVCYSVYLQPSVRIKYLFHIEKKNEEEEEGRRSKQ